MNLLVTPADGVTVPSSAAHVSRVRTLVVPTATTRPPPRAALISAAVSGGNRYGSGWIPNASTSSVRIGEKVPYPTDRVTRATPTPAVASSPRRSSSKWRPAVGAATEPGFLANTVWYRTASSFIAGSPRRRRMYGGNGTSPARSSAFATETFPPDRSTSHRPSSSLRSRRTFRTPPNSNASPSESRFEGRASASQRSSPAAPVSARGDRRKTSTAPPVPRVPRSRPWRTFVSLTTSKSPRRSRNGSSEKNR